jgi:hypothetical protein
MRFLPLIVATIVFLLADVADAARGHAILVPTQRRALAAALESP